MPCYTRRGVGDDTPVTLLTPGIGEGSRQARFWLYRGPATAPFNVFAFTDSRAREGPDRLLETFTGTLTGDCYSGYVNIEKVTRGRIRFAACVSHARRKVFDAREQQPALSSQVLALVRALYDVEDRARPLDDAGRLALRQRDSVPLMAQLRAVLDSEPAVRVLPKSSFGEALAYWRNHWAAFQLYLHDARLPIDNKTRSGTCGELPSVEIMRSSALCGVAGERAGNFRPRKRPQLHIISSHLIEEVQQRVGLLATTVSTWWFLDAFQDLPLHLQVRLHILVGCFRGLMSQPQGDQCHVDIGLKKVHGRGMSQRVRGDILAPQ